MNDFAPFGGSSEVANIFAKLFVDGAGGGEIFPFGFLAFVDIFDVARFKIGIVFSKGAVIDDAAANTGRESEVE